MMKHLQQSVLCVPTRGVGTLFVSTATKDLIEHLQKQSPTYLRSCSWFDQLEGRQRNNHDET